MINYSFNRSYTVTILPLLVIITLWFSAMFRAQGHFERAHSLEQEGHILQALRHYQWAARSYYPFTQVGESSVLRLWELGQEFKSKQQTTLALHSLDLLRGALWSTRWFAQPYSNYQDKVDQEIAELRSSDVDRSKLLLALADDPRPNPLQSLFLLLSMIGLFSSILCLLTFGLTPQLKWKENGIRYLYWVILSAVGIMLSLVEY